MVDDHNGDDRRTGPSTGPAFPLPPSTPLPTTYPCELGTQHAEQNFRPRTFTRVPSSTESQAALRRTLQKYWGHRDFRGPQLEICTYALKGCDLLVVAPTGLGKSVCFQVPAVAIEYGITIVISPLLALMRDQVSGLRAKGIQAYQLSEKTDPNDIRIIKKQLRMGHPQLRLLYVTPETLFSAKYAADLDIAYRQKQIVRLVVDEAHVIDEWGSTFRPTYRRLGEFRIKYPSVPITALTASATSDVRDDMTTILNMPKTPEHGLAQWVEPFNRKNLFYEIRYQGGFDKQNETTKDIVGFIHTFREEAAEINKRHDVRMPCVSGLVYCRYKADCDMIAALLNARGVTARPFYATLPEYARNAALDDWKEGRVECIVATIAFGMGVDQAHVRYIIHYDMPKSFEGYYQETGRAGRDGHMSRCVLYYSREDAAKLRGLVCKEADKGKNSGNDQATLERGKLRMVNSFKALQFYAEGGNVCRHISICRYFGEKIDDITQDIKDKYCGGMCDVCANCRGVFQRTFKLTEDIEVASPIIKPAPLDPAPEYFSLSTQAGQNSLAAWHRPTMAGSNMPPTAPMATIREAPGLMPPPPPPAGQASSSGRALGEIGGNPFMTPMRAMTIDDAADSGFNAVAFGEERSPDHAEHKRRARDVAFKGVEPASGGGPFAFYNSSAPRKRTKVNSGFKVPSLSMAETSQVGLVAGGMAVVSQMSEVGPMPGGTGAQADRGAGLGMLRTALNSTFMEGTYADQVLEFWGRREEGERRGRLIRKVARELELDMAKMDLDGEPYLSVMEDTIDALKLVRDQRGVNLVLSDRLDRIDDARIERFRHVATCFRTVKVNK